MLRGFTAYANSLKKSIRICGRWWEIREWHARWRCWWTIFFAARIKICMPRPQLRWKNYITSSLSGIEVFLFQTKLSCLSFCIKKSPPQRKAFWIWGGWSDLNWRHLVPQTSALTNWATSAIADTLITAKKYKVKKKFREYLNKFFCLIKRLFPGYKGLCIFV